jgi:hypothetical protein
MSDTKMSIGFNKISVVDRNDREDLTQFMKEASRRILSKDCAMPRKTAQHTP